MKTKLKELFDDQEMIDKVEAILKDELKDKYIPKQRFDELNEQKKKFEELVAERDGQLEALKSATGNEDKLKKQIEDLQAANQKAKEEYDANIKAMRRDDFVKTTLMEAGLLDTKFIPGVSAYLSIADLDVDNVGSVDAFKTKLNEVKTTVAPTWFKSDTPPATEINGMKINDPISKVPPGDEGVDKNSYEYILAQTLKTKE